MPKKGQKKLRGQPEIYDEVKGQVNLSLTKASVQGLDEQALAMGLSRSEFVEKIGRRMITALSEDEQRLVRDALHQLISITERELASPNRSAEHPDHEAQATQLLEKIEQWQSVLAKLI